MDKQTLEQKRDEASDMFDKSKAEAEQAETTAQEARNEMLRWQGEWRAYNKLIDLLTPPEVPSSTPTTDTPPADNATKIDVIEDTSSAEEPATHGE